MEEIWKDVVGYEGLYMVSNFGNIKSLDRYVNSSYNSKQFIKGKNIKKLINRTGYYTVSLANNTKPKKFTVHRIVAKTFIYNSNGNNVINHKDGDKLNNNIENLEWCTIKENTQHAWKNLGLVAHFKGVFGKNNPLSKKVKQIDKYGNVIKIRDSVADVGRSLNKSTSMISECCLGKGNHKTAYGYKREY